MQRILIFTFTCFVLLISTLDAFAAKASVLGEHKAYPTFQVGVTGAWVSIQPGQIMQVDRVDRGSPAHNQLRAGDVIIAVNRRPIQVEDPRIALGSTLTEAEATNGQLQFTIKRGGISKEVLVKVAVLGAYSATWPVDCEKSEQIVNATAKRLAASQTKDGWFDAKKKGDLTQCLAALFLMSMDEKAYDKNVRGFAYALASSMNPRRGSNVWQLGYRVIFLSEYYLKTGDRKVLPAIKAACRVAAEHQVAGAWGHTLGGVNPGYVQSGLMNNAGVTMFLGMALARECGIDVHEEAFQRSLVFFYRMAGRGSIGYGDHRPEQQADTNGRNAAIACAFSLLEEEPYTQAGRHLAMMVADSYFRHESGHTGGGFNVIWRGITMGLLVDDSQGKDHVRRHMDQLAWYYDLCRMSGGQFRMLPWAPKGETRYTDTDWGLGVALAYTAQNQTLRITGKERGKHSKRTPRLDPKPWGTDRDTEFLSTEHAQGYGQDDQPPHEIKAKLHGPGPVSAAYCGRMLMHYNPAIRITASRILAQQNDEAAFDVIEAALQHRDVRVRRAACDTISGYQSFKNGKSGAGMSRQVVSDRFVPHLLKILADKDAAWWEIDGAQWALGAALPKDIRRAQALLSRSAQHEEWYLRESAFWARVGLGDKMTGDELLALADMYMRSGHVFERKSMGSGFDFLLRRAKLKPDDQTIAAFVRRIGTSAREIEVAFGYDKYAAHHEAVHRTMMILERFKDPPYELIAKDFVVYLKHWEPGNQHSNWLVMGSKWQPGLAQIALDMGPDGRAIIAALKAREQDVTWNERQRTHREVHKVILETVKAFEARHGRVGRG